MALLWTIPFEVAAYALLLVMYILSEKEKQSNYLTICLLLIIILPVFNFGDGLFFNKDNLSVSLLAPCFALGSLFALHKNNIEVSLKYPCAFIVVCYLASDPYLKHLMFYFSAITAFLYLGTTNFIKKIKIKYDISYAVYLWGFLVQQTVFHYAPDLNLFVNQILCIALTIILAIPTFLLIEQPAINLGKRMVKKL